MIIEKNNFFEIINSYNEDEIFYKNLYEEEKYRPDNFVDYLNSLDLDLIKSNQLYVPQIHGKWVSYMNEDSLISDSNITLLKHNRYSPEFIHEHEFYEIIYVYKGECKNTIENVGTMTYLEGDVCITPPKTKHSIAVFDDSIIVNISIRSSTFHSTFFDLFTGSNVLSQFFSHILYSKTEDNYLLFRTNANPIIRSIVEDLFIEFNNNEKYSTTILNSYIMTFWSMLLRHHENDIKSFLNTNNSQLTMISILNYLQDNFKEITLSEAADYFCFSVPHFSKIIKDNTGQNFTQIIKNIKLEKACKLLKDTTLNISTISDMVGYANLEHFNRTFKKEFEISPGEYRKREK